MLGHCHIDNGSPYAAVTVLEWVNALEPEVRNSGTRQTVEHLAIQRGSLGEPREEARHLRKHVLGWRRFVMHNLTTRNAAHNQHRVVMVTVSADSYSANARCAPREQGRLPAA